MDKAKKKRLEEAGWTVGSAEEFLGINKIGLIRKSVGNFITKIGQWVGLIPTDCERKTLEALAKHGRPSMRVVGRGTLTMSVEDAQKSETYKKLLAKANEIIN